MDVAEDVVMSIKMGAEEGVGVEVTLYVWSVPIFFVNVLNVDPNVSPIFLNPALISPPIFLNPRPSTEKKDSEDVVVGSADREEILSGGGGNEGMVRFR